MPQVILILMLVLLVRRGLYADLIDLLRDLTSLVRVSLLAAAPVLAAGQYGGTIPVARNVQVC